MTESNDLKVGQRVYYFQHLQLKEDIVVEVNKTFAMLGFHEKLVPVSGIYATKIEALDSLTVAMFNLKSELQGEGVAQEMYQIVVEGEGDGKNE